MNPIWISLAFTVAGCIVAVTAVIIAAQERIKAANKAAEREREHAKEIASLRADKLDDLKLKVTQINGMPRRVEHIEKVLDPIPASIARLSAQHEALAERMDTLSRSLHDLLDDALVRMGCPATTPRKTGGGTRKKSG